MGSSSKVLLVGATSLIVGVYAISLKNVQTIGLKTAQSQVNQMQNERLVDAALVLALNKVKNTGGNYNTPTYGPDDAGRVLGADISYRIKNADGNSATILLTITKGNFTEIVKATVEKTQGSHGHRWGLRRSHRGNWQLTNAFVQRG
jgi:hypothetical protein